MSEPAPPWRIRLPLYGKILVWFFLNLVLVTAGFALLFNAQFKLNLEWLLFTGARERLEAVKDLIVGELDATAPVEWPEVLRRYNAAQHVEFSIFDEEAKPIIGETTELPEEVRLRIATQPAFPWAINHFRPSSAPRGQTQNASTPAVLPASPSPSAPAANRPIGIPVGVSKSRENRRTWKPPLRAIMRTTGPTQYWLMSSARLDNPLAGDPLRVILIARSNSLSAGGLIFNPKPWLGLLAGVFVCSLLFWLPLVQSITRTISRMMQATRQIADGHFDVRVNLQRRDELGGLAESINQMAIRLDGLATGRKRFLGDIAHELCSPLVRLQMALGILEQQATPEQTPFVRSASEKAALIASLVSELLSFSKAELGASNLPLEPIRVSAVVAEAIRREITEGIEVILTIPENLQVIANPELLTRAVANLLRNSIQHAAKSGPITLHAEACKSEVLLSLSDCGPGVPESELPKIFDAFYRLDPSRNRDTGGTGLGLAIVKTCVESCAGSVSASNRQPHGLLVELKLQRALP